MPTLFFRAKKKDRHAPALFMFLFLTRPRKNRRPTEESEATEESAVESSAAEEVESVPSSETVEVVLVLEVLLVELLPPPEQAAMLRARVRAKKPARSFFIVSFPFIAKIIVRRPCGTLPGAGPIPLPVHDTECTAHLLQIHYEIFTSFLLLDAKSANKFS